MDTVVYSMYFNAQKLVLNEINKSHDKKVVWYKALFPQQNIASVLLHLI